MAVEPTGAVVLVLRRAVNVRGSSDEHGVRRDGGRTIGVVSRGAATVRRRR